MLRSDDRLASLLIAAHEIQPRRYGYRVNHRAIPERLFIPAVLRPVAPSAKRHCPIIVRLLPDTRIDLRRSSV